MQTIWKDTKMGILITKVRIENYRSIENMEVSSLEAGIPNDILSSLPLI